MSSKPAAILTTLIIAILLLAACSGPPTEAPPTGAPATTLPPTDAPAAPTQAPPTETAAPTEPPPTPTTAPTPAPTASATAPAFLRIPSVSCCRGRTLTAGRYEIPPWLGIPLSVEAPDGWRALNEEGALLFLLGRGQNVQNNPSQMILFLNASDGDTPETIIGSIQNAEQLAPMGEPVEVTFAGFPGLQLDASALPNPTFEGRPQDDIPPGVQYLPVIEQYLTPGFAWTTSSPEARVRAVALTVGEQTLLLYLEAPPEEFDQFAADAEAILQSLELIDP
jgi:hypothetical protein